MAARKKAPRRAAPDRLYSTPQTVRAVSGAVGGIGLPTLQMWISRKMLPDLAPPPGVGRSQKLSFLDVLRFAVMASLTKGGFVASVAAAAAAKITDPNTRELLHISQPSSRTYRAIGAPEGPVAAFMAPPKGDWRRRLAKEDPRIWWVAPIDVPGLAHRLRQVLADVEQWDRENPEMAQLYDRLDYGKS